ncbi:acyl carrier protein [Streptomyces sp. NPDC005808]|uniref:acyl carrier protein n=1 Tax=Streptomyces sp. NPDC005808 TaxID=3364734 RepID=UPI00367B91D2
MTDIAPTTVLGQFPDLSELRAMSPASRTAVLVQCLRLHLDQILHVPPAHRTGSERPLRSQGLDRLDALRLSRGLRRDLGTEISAQALLDGSVAELAALLSARLAPGPSGPAGAA